MSIRSKRKDDHVELALSLPKPKDPFESMRLVHNSIPNMNLSDVDTSTRYLNRDFPYPVYINAMTGGSEKTGQINKKLALIAARLDIPMAVGSQHVALEHPEYEDSFKIVRETNPHGFLIGNVSANASVDDAQRAIAMIQANALGIHINVAQELTMDEGDRDFAHWLDHIEAIVKAVDVPVIVKEVGFGMNDATVKQLYERGVKHVDVSGHGGTNFISIENARSVEKRYDYLTDWGLTAIESLQITKPYHDKLEIIASGGVKTPLDVLKLIRLGAKAVGISGTFLKMTQHDDKEMMRQADNFFEDLRRIMVLIGAGNIKEVTRVPYQIKESWVIVRE